jgi:hypothetical protein
LPRLSAGPEKVAPRKDKKASSYHKRVVSFVFSWSHFFRTPQAAAIRTWSTEQIPRWRSAVARANPRSSAFIRGFKSETVIGKSALTDGFVLFVTLW